MVDATTRGQRIYNFSTQVNQVTHGRLRRQGMWSFLMAVSIGSIGCETGGGGSGTPNADAGPDQQVAAQATVMLDGTDSSDPNGAALTFMWVQTSGPSVTLSDATSSMPTFTAPAATSSVTLVFMLTVNNGSAVDSDSVSVMVTGGSNVVNVVSRFDDGDEGWRIMANDTKTIPEHGPSGGRPGGYVYDEDQTSGEEWFWVAPDKFLGNVSAGIGRTLTFDLFESLPANRDTVDDVVLVGAGLTLRYDFPTVIHPDEGWTAFSVRLASNAGWEVVSPDADRPPTSAEMLAVMSSLQGLYIRGDYRNRISGFPAMVGLDNVVLDLGSDPVCPVLADNVASHFDTDAEGWQVLANDEQGDAGASFADHFVAGGRPGGFVSMLDIRNDAIWTWDAPEAFLGNASAAYGRSLSFDLFETPATIVDTTDDVVLRGGGIVLAYDIDTAVQPNSGWCAFNVPLDETDPRWTNVVTGDRPTHAQFQTVLACLQQIQIRGDYRNRISGFPATAGLDNVILDLGSAPICPVRTDNVVSTFDGDVDGWLALGNDPEGDAGASFADHFVTGGRPGGFVSIDDETNDEWMWNAPEKFLGDVSAAYGRTLRFDLFESIRTVRDTAHDVVLRGAGHVLCYNIPTVLHPEPGWASYSVHLSETDTGWTNVITGDRPTQAEMMAVLSCLQQIKILGDYRNRISGFPATDGLDNVILDLGSGDLCPVRSLDVLSTFSADADGWLALGNDPQGDAGSSSPDHSVAGGNPDGFISMLDMRNDAVWTWDAPAKYLGDVSAAHGRTLSFDLTENPPAANVATGCDVILRGAGIVLCYDIATANNPDEGWTTYSILLDESDVSWTNVATGARPTEAEMLAVLSCLQQLQIRADYRNGISGTPATAGLDSVELDITD